MLSIFAVCSCIYAVLHFEQEMLASLNAEERRFQNSLLGNISTSSTVQTGQHA